MRLFLQILLIVLVQAALYSPAQAMDGRNWDLSCKGEVISPVDYRYDSKWSYNRELVSASYGLFAAANVDAYADRPNDIVFDIGRRTLGLGWYDFDLKYKSWKINRYSNGPTGLSFDVYYRPMTGCTVVLIAIRGTDFTSFGDWYSNLSWFTQVLHLRDQYKEISEQFVLVRDMANRRFGQKNVRFIVTGHSLGGGLARHLAACFDGISAVVFDPSPVIRGCGKEPPVLVQISEDHEILQNIRTISDWKSESKENTRSFSRYKVNMIELGKGNSIRQHSMINLAAGMLRMPLNCRTQSQYRCEISDTFVKQTHDYSYKLYCGQLRREYPDLERDLARKSAFKKSMKRGHDEVCVPR